MSADKKLEPERLKVKIEREKSRNDIILSATSLASALEELRSESNYKKLLDSSTIIAIAVCDLNLRYLSTTELWNRLFMGGVRPPYVPIVTGRYVRDLQGVKGIEPVVSMESGKFFAYWERWKDGLDEGFIFYVIHA
jgi:hypothetical protein